jgi:predicted ATPase
MAELSHPSPPAQSSPLVALVGRATEEHRLAALLAAAESGQGHLVLVGGEAGMGKTALTRAVIAKAAAHGATILIGHCYDLSVTPPYGPWRELFARLPSDEGLPPLPTALAVDSDADPAGEADLFRRVHDIIGAFSRGN